jgi:ribA/ribD-fused uncharacterized protein
MMAIFTPSARGSDAGDTAQLDQMVLAGFDEIAVDSYRRTQCAVFRKTNEQFGGLSNMAAGFPLWVNGIEIRTSEAAYQAARFPHLPDVQREILAQASPMAAKMKGKPHRHDSRPNFDADRVQIMWWSLRVKLACNPTRFSQLLASTGERPIVEDSHKDTYWGSVAVKDNPTLLRGANVLGRLLIALRDLVGTFDPRIWQVVAPPAIPGFTLFGNPIGIIDGSRIGRGQNPVAATPLPGKGDTGNKNASKARALDALCPNCFIALPAKGHCDNCE